MTRTIIAVTVALAVAAALASLAPAPRVQAGEVVLHKTPGCGCCEAYADYLRDHGFTVTVKATHQLATMSRAAGIAGGFEGCHLAFVDGYAVSGHVPVGTINRLLAERPAIKGVTLPGMPVGSPGMPGPKSEPFTIYAVGPGKPKVYAVE